MIDNDRQQLISRLRELIDALDSRVPHLEREGELRIAGDAAALRTKAVERIAQVEAGVNRLQSGGVRWMLRRALHV